MRVHFSTSWIFQGWIASLVFGLCIQGRHARPSCSVNQYIKGNKCCTKCAPGTFLFASCTDNRETDCLPCGTDEYQPEYNTEEKCRPQKFCDYGKGFYRVSPSSRTQPEPCQCKKGYQCSRMNCEFCERIPSCIAGQGLMDESGHQSCKECDPGFFSDSNSSEPCKKWTDCSAIGKTQATPGSTKTDVVCGAPFGLFTSWAVVAIPCGIVVVFAVIFSCYREKLSVFSVNLRTCVQSIKRSRIQQETLTPPYHSTGLQNSPLYEITSHLIRQDHSPPEYLRMCSETKLTSCGAPDPVLTQSHEQDRGSTGSERDRACGSLSGSSGEGLEFSPASPLSGSTCSCQPSLKEPVEVGDNEDCSQLVAHSLGGCCSCVQRDPRDTSEVPGGSGGAVTQEKPLCGTCYSDSLLSCQQSSQELYLDYSAHVGRGGLSQVGGLSCSSRQSEPCCCSIDSTTAPPNTTLATSTNQGLSLSDGTGSDLSDPHGHLEVLTQRSEAALTCGHGTENDTTSTFMSNGQVMNVTGDVIMVYVSQTSLSNTNRGDDPCGCPVQEGSGEGRYQPAPKYPAPPPGGAKQLPQQVFSV
ncbi:tumor necrosis factor receptor superfamily member 11A [Brachyhypopomus gauderio]|uniref:tumor necrosis factor receptor superfamily member 11A n=1 Tax=Brachyhypopomus gauderio TaxID=698409 RepID=UPI004042A3E1